MKKKINALLIAAGLTISACSLTAFAQEPSAEPAPVGEIQTQAAEGPVLSEEEQKAEEARAFAENLIFRLAQASEEELDELRDTGSDSIKIAIANWDNVKEELGVPVEILDQKVNISEDGKTYTIVSDVKYDGVSDNTKVTDTVDLNVRTNVYTVDFDVAYPKGKLFGEAALNTIMGIGTVFLVLLFLSWLISNIHWIPDLVEKYSKKGFVVRTIRKSNRENWLRA